MTVLAVAITAATTPIPIDSPLTVGSYRAPYSLGSENILVVGGSGTAYLSVERGANGTVPAAHAAGTALTSGWGGGGSGVTVDNGVDAPAAVGTIVAAGATIDGDSATLPLNFRRLGPVTVNFNTPGFINPADDGPAVLTIPAWSLFSAFAITTETFDIAGQLILVAGDASNINTVIVAGYTGDFNGHAGHVLAESNYIFTSVGNLSADISRWAIAPVESVVCVGYYPIGADPTAGSANIYALIATPRPPDVPSLLSSARKDAI